MTSWATKGKPIIYTPFESKFQVEYGHDYVTKEKNGMITHPLKKDNHHHYQARFLV